MSELLSDVLNKQDKYLVSSEKKEHGISRVMKGKYDFEKFLLDNIDTVHDISADNSVSENTFDKDADAQQIHNDTNLVFMKDNKLHSSSRTIDGYGIIYARSVPNEINLLADNLIKLEKSSYAGFLQKESIKLSRVSLNDKQIVKLVHQNNKVVDIENIRLVKSDVGYTLYVNDDGLNLTPSKLIELLKIIHSDKRVSIHKVILNREIVFDKSKPFITESVVDNTDDSHLNIRI